SAVFAVDFMSIHNLVSPQDIEQGRVPMTRTIHRRLRIATLAPGGAPFGLVEGGVGVEDGRIAWVGEAPSGWLADAVVDHEGRLATPALIDCHTHLVFGGNRAREFDMRLNGASYEEIARAGGGIRSSVSATAAASEDELVASALPRLDTLIAEGLGTIEIKSGYG